MRRLGVPLSVDYLTDRNIVSPDGVNYEGGFSISVPNGVLAHVKGTPPTEVTAATTRDYGWVSITVTSGSFASATNTSMLVDLCFGAAASEIVVVPNLALGYKQTPYVVEFPLFVPKGTRVSMAMQRNNTGTNLGCHVQFGYDEFYYLAPRKITAMGINTALSRGTTMAAPASNSSGVTKGAWTEIIATTVEPYSAVFMLEQGNSDTSLGSGGLGVDLAVGSAGNEQQFVSDHVLRQDTTEAFSHRGVSAKLIQRHIPAGSRISARYYSGDITGSLDLSVYGVPVR